MGLKDRLARMERAAGGHFTTAACPECGEAFRYAGDLALDLVVAQWVRATGTDYEVDPTVARVLDHPHEGLVHEALSDLPAFRRAR
ncbi:MAG: hypothetical protein M3N18_06730 [Actinomycetota bacterium]|nr:hypothetical protein [Actinomycetota bacterium]